MPLNPGQVINSRYRIARLLGQGGFGAVYRAYDLNLNRFCALKENLDTSQQAREQFEREARILANLSHPSLARVTDYFSIPGQGQYLVMDFVEGEDLQDMLDRLGTPLPEAQAIGWITQVCDALSYIHRQTPPIIHRDIKPANIKITPQGQAVLVDFGIAKVFDPHLRTTVGARAVTPGYSPPEQYGHGLTDQRSDIYALGATLYTLLTCQTPPESLSVLTRAAPPAPPARSLNPTVSAHTSGVVEAAMRVDTQARFASAAELKSALLGSGVAPTRPAAAPDRARGFPWGWVAAIAGGVIILGLLAAVIGLAYMVANNETAIPTARPTRTSDVSISGNDNSAAGDNSSRDNPPAPVPRSEPTSKPDLPSPDPTTDPAAVFTSAAFTLVADLTRSAPPATHTPLPPTRTPVPANTATNTPAAQALATPPAFAFSMGAVGSADIYMAPGLSGEYFCVTCGSSDESDPAWSPDGNYLVYQDDTDDTYDIWRIDLRSGSKQKLTFDSSNDEREPAWSPDGTSIVYQVNVHGAGNRDGEIWIMDANGSNARSLGINGRGPAWSPDGTMLAYMSNQSGLWQIYVYTFSSRRQQMVTDCSVNCRWPAWSPDNRYVVYNETTSATSTDPHGIFYVPANGGTSTAVLTGGPYGRPSWTAAGLILFNSTSGIEVINPNGTGRNSVINDGRAWAPIWYR